MKPTSFLPLAASQNPVVTGIAQDYHLRRRLRKTSLGAVMVLQIANAANRFVKFGIALVAGATLVLNTPFAKAEDITWYSFDPPQPLTGMPNKTSDCTPSPGVQAAWYRFCEAGTNTIGYYSMAAYSCSGPPAKTIWLLAMRGTTKTPCNAHQAWETAVEINALTGLWPAGNYPQPTTDPNNPDGPKIPPKEPDNPGGASGKIGGLKVPEGEKPTDKTALTSSDGKTASTDSKDTDQTQQNSNPQNSTPQKSNQQRPGTQTQEKSQTPPPVRATRDPTTGKLILDGPLGDQASATDSSKRGETPQGATAAATCPIDPKSVSDAQLKALLADPQVRSRVVTLLGGDTGKPAASKTTVKPNTAQRPAKTDSGISPEGAAAAGALIGIGVGIGVGRMGGDR